MFYATSGHSAGARVYIYTVDEWEACSMSLLDTLLKYVYDIE